MASAESATNEKNPYKKLDIYELNKCTLCGYSSHIKSTFQRHLMKSHGIKLKNLEEGTSSHYANLGRVQDDYLISVEDKFKEKEAFNFTCSRCQKNFRTDKQLSYHRKSCQKLMKAMKKGLPLWTCPQCSQPFLKRASLNKHQAHCGKEKNIHCILCPLKSIDMSRMVRHFIDKHNLICLPVNEPDFEQALNNAPYMLDRPIAVESLPDINNLESLPEEIELRGVGNKRRQKPTWLCNDCKMEFSKQKHLNRHRKTFHP